MITVLIRIYHATTTTLETFRSFLEGISKILHEKSFTLGISYRSGEFFYTLTAEEAVVRLFESKLYTEFPDFQIVSDTKHTWDFSRENSVAWDVHLLNGWFFPFASLGATAWESFMTKMWRSFDGLNLTTDHVGFFLTIEPFEAREISFFLGTWFRILFFRIRLFFTGWKYIFNKKVEKDWKQKGFSYFRAKLREEVFSIRSFIVVESTDTARAKSLLEGIFHNFTLFRNLPFNEFRLRTLSLPTSVWDLQEGKNITPMLLTAGEISRLYHFPPDPAKETALVKINARKLALPTGMLIPPYHIEKGNIVVDTHDPWLCVLGESDYRSIHVPLGIYDEDRLRHMYIVGKTGVGKSKFLISLLADDIMYGKGIAVIDPHGDLIEEVMMHIPTSRHNDVILFDPTDEQFPFSFNPLHIRSNESKQILAKGFIDIFKKFFWANWNPKLEHVLRMVFLGLLDVKDSTVFDIVRALTDKDFRYMMIEHVQDDVVRNFWTNEFAGWSQQFNSEAIMPILNKVGQLLSIDMLKNIFTSRENKLDFREVMDTGKILLIKLPKGRLQEEIMGFLWAMMVTKIYQSAMGRQGTDKTARKPFFLYIDEFQNFATDTFGEILSEARKYGLGLIVAHQFVAQLPNSIAQALFGNVGSLVSFRVSSEDAKKMAEQFDPAVKPYDLANLSAREAYVKTLVAGQVRDPLSMRTRSVPDTTIDPNTASTLYTLSRAKYARSLAEAKQKETASERETLKQIERFMEPIL